MLYIYIIWQKNFWQYLERDKEILLRTFNNYFNYIFTIIIRMNYRSCYS